MGICRAGGEEQVSEAPERGGGGEGVLLVRLVGGLKGRPTAALQERAHVVL